MKRKFVLLSLSLILVIGITGCDKTKGVNESSAVDSTVNAEMSETQNDETSKNNEVSKSEDGTPKSEDSNLKSDDGAAKSDDSDSKSDDGASKEDNKTIKDDAGTEKITSDQALLAIRNYCIKQQPELADMANSEDYTLYWEVEASDADQTVVLYRSYTGAQVRYYVDSKTGDVYVTEFVPGITEEEERTEETFNVKEYMDDSTLQEKGGSSDIANTKTDASALEGTWQSASMVEIDGVMQPEKCVQFTNKAIHYGQWKDGEFAEDYSDEISSFEKLDNNGFRVQAKNSNGVQYTYQTSETDPNIMEYYETWNEDDFADAYSGSSSLFKQ